MTTEVSAGLVKKGKNLLMIFDEETETWALPSERTESGELSADTAVRAVSQLTECECEVVRYHRNLKVEFLSQGEEFKMQAYTIDIQGEPEKGEWVPVSELSSRQLASPIEKIEDELVKRV